MPPNAELAGCPNYYANTLGLSFSLAWILSAQRTVNCRLPRPPPTNDPELRSVECRRLLFLPLSGPRSAGKSPRARSEMRGRRTRVVSQSGGINCWKLPCHCGAELPELLSLVPG